MNAVGDRRFPVAKLRATWQATSCWDDIFACDLNWHRAPHNFQQDANAAGVVETIQCCKLLGEWTGDEADFCADPEMRHKAEEAPLIERIKHRFYNAARYRLWHFTLHDEARDADGSVNASPTMPFEVEPHEEVAWEKWCRDIRQLTSMTHRLEALREEDLVILIFQVLLRAQFMMWLSVDCIPALVRDFGHYLRHRIMDDSLAVPSTSCRAESLCE